MMEPASEHSNLQSFESNKPSASDYVHPSPSYQRDRDGYKNALANPSVGHVAEFHQFARPQHAPRDSPAAIQAQKQQFFREKNPGYDLNNSAYWSSQSGSPKKKRVRFAETQNTRAHRGRHEPKAKPMNKISRLLQSYNNKKTLKIIVIILIVLLFVVLVVVYVNKRNQSMPLMGGSSSLRSSSGSQRMPIYKYMN